MRSPFIKLVVGIPQMTGPSGMTGKVQSEEATIIAHYQSIHLDYHKSSMAGSMEQCYLYYGDHQFKYIDKASFDRISEQLLKMTEENRIVLEFETKDRDNKITHHVIPCNPYDVSLQSSEDLSKCEIMIRYDLNASTGWITFSTPEEYKRIKQQLEEARR